MRLYDVSVPIGRSTPVFKGDPPVICQPALQIREGAPLNLTKLTMGSHTGTHIDAPYHFLETGVTVDSLPLEVFMGRAEVRHMDTDEAVTVAHLEAADIPPGTQRVLLKTRNSALWTDPWFHEDFVYIHAQAAQWLVERGIRLVGIDYLSVEKFGDTQFPTHRTLLENGVVIVEGLDLREVAPGSYDLVCFPLRIAGCDGAPTRAVLVDRAGARSTYPF